MQIVIILRFLLYLQVCVNIVELIIALKMLEDIEDSAALALNALLPEKSKEKYEKAFKEFENWCLQKSVQDVNEEVLLAYFEQKSRILKGSTLWSLYSMLRATINVNKNIEIKNFPRLIAFIKRKSAGQVAKKSNVFTKSEVERFLKEADDDKYLLMKVVLIVGISGALRREEITFLDVNNVKDMRSFFLITIPNTKTNVRREFAVSRGNFDGTDLLSVFRKYYSLRPPRIENTRFFIGYRNGRCTRQAVGINTIAGIPKKIAEFLKLRNPLTYTGHCFRRTSATLLADAGADITLLKRHGSWKSSSVAESYIENSVENKLRIASKIVGQPQEQSQDSNKPVVHCDDRRSSEGLELDKKAQEQNNTLNEKSDATASNWLFGNCSNFVVNIYKQ